jgi:cysteine synthase
MAQGVAWQARRLGLACTVVAPDHAPETKLAALRRLGAKIIQIPFEEWFQILATHSYTGMDGLFVHPVSNRDVMAGNATIALEILDDLPDADAVIAPFGGGGLSCDIAAGLRALRPQAKMFVSEVDTSAALAAALAADIHAHRIPRQLRRRHGEPIRVAGDVAAGEEPARRLDRRRARRRRRRDSHAGRAPSRDRRGAGGSSLAAALTGKASASRSRA